MNGKKSDGEKYAYKNEADGSNPPYVQKYPSETRRYAAQVKLMGFASQKKLMDAKIIQIGAGGLGSPLLFYLAATGIGTIHLFDDDVVEDTNLGRQILYEPGDIGKPKVQCAKKKISKFNPSISVVPHKKRAKETTLAPLAPSCDYLIDASDNFPTKFLSNDMALKYKIPYTVASVRGYEGQILSVDPGKSACFRCAYGSPEVEKSEKAPQVGILGTTCGILGMLQANEVIYQLAGLGRSFLNTILFVNLRGGDFVKISVAQNQSCKCNFGQ